MKPFEDPQTNEILRTADDEKAQSEQLSSN